MTDYRFETVDVFTDRRFGGNPLAVFPDARGLSASAMQSIAREFNLSETTFVLPPADPAHTAQVRIFTPMNELPFAGHPNVGTALVLAAHRPVRPDTMLFEEAAGLVPIRFDWSGRAPMATLDAPLPLSRGTILPASVVARCAGLREDQVLLRTHAPVIAGMGTNFVFAEVTSDGLAAATADAGAMRDAAAQFQVRSMGFPLHLWARDGQSLRTRMFAPLSGIPEDPATGSANVALAGLLLPPGAAEHRLLIHQGIEMGRPSLLHAAAWQAADGIRASIGGGAVAVMRGSLTV